MTTPSDAPLDTPLRATIVTVTPLQQNCTLIWCTATMRCAVVDPGGDPERIRQAVAQAGVTVEKVLLTHGHIDHAGLARPFADGFKVPVEGPHADDAFLLERLDADGARWGLPGVPMTPDRWLADGDRVTVGELVLDVYHAPGHSPGHVIFHHAPSRFAQVGDVLFQGSVGRTDLPGGDHAVLVRSIREKLWPLGSTPDDDTFFVPGHGRPSSFAHERATNPYAADAP